jgi:ADP-heptose:LPS heptosyltransferase
MALTFLVPPGIGDFSAIYQKLCCINREIIIRPSADCPERIAPYLEILPKIKYGGYSGHGANTSVFQTLPPGTDLANLKDGVYILSINTFLEQGGKVADWIPGPTDYHYEILKPESAMRPLGHFLGMLPGAPLVGIYCSAYGNSRHWGFWGTEEWREFLELLRADLPQDTEYIFIGAEYDVQIADYLAKWMNITGSHAYDTLGCFHIAATIELIRKLDYFFVFPSGLGFLADVVRTPNLMWFPNHLSPMCGTFCDPEQYESKQSLHAMFSTPEEAYKTFKQFGYKHLEERLCHRT